MDADVVTRLRRWTHAVDAAPASDLMDEAADEITRLRLTDAERQAVKAAIECCEDITYGSPDEPEAAATLRGLLERLK